MKKWILLLTIGGIHAHAQNLPSRWSLGLAAGPAFTIGDFHRLPAAVGGNSGNGAQRGGSIELSGALRVWRSLSATLVIEGQDNKGYGIPYWFVDPTSDKAAGPPRGDTWKIARVLAGAVYTWPVTKKTGIAVLTRVLGGVQRTISPDYKDAVFYLDFLTSGRPSYVIYPGLTFPWCFSYEADAGLQWRSHSRFSAIGYIGYEGAKPSVTKAYINSLHPSTNSFITAYPGTTYATNSISLRAGVSYDLSR